MDELEQKYLALLKRISCYPMPEAARAAILAQVEAMYRQTGGAGSEEFQGQRGERGGKSGGIWP